MDDDIKISSWCEIRKKYTLPFPRSIPARLLVAIIIVEKKIFLIGLGDSKEFTAGQNSTRAHERERISRKGIKFLGNSVDLYNGLQSNYAFVAL